jgi:hypothetical protein
VILKIDKLEDAEICHFYDKKKLVLSKFNVVMIKEGKTQFSITIPINGWKRFFGFSRLLRRALRLDKCNVIPVDGGYVIISQGKVYRYDVVEQSLAHVWNLQNCRNVLHQSIAVISGKEIYFGEYGNNGDRAEVPVYRSIDAGKTWKTVFTFAPGKIKHVHGCFYDVYENKIWTLTGDFKNECYLLCSDRDFKHLEWIGDGNQVYRACNLFFEKDEIHWIMDSQLEESFHVRMNRKSRNIQLHQPFPGPVWYIKRLSDGYYLAATAQEVGAGVKDDLAHLFVSTDLSTWTELKQFYHDGLPKRIFKFGVLGFADGLQESNSFYMFAEAIKGYDGKAFLCSIQPGG